MPTIGVEKEDFLRRTGIAKSVTQLELEHLFFDLGLELDDIEEENGKVWFLYKDFVNFHRLHKKNESQNLALS